MNTSEILSAIDQEISRLEQARSLLQSSNGPSTHAVEVKRRGRPPGKATKAPVTTEAPVKQARTMSEDGRARIAAAQKARWAAKKKADTKAAKAAALGAGREKVHSRSEASSGEEGICFGEAGCSKEDSCSCKISGSEEGGCCCYTCDRKEGGRQEGSASRKEGCCKEGRAGESSSKKESG